MRGRRPNVLYILADQFNANCLGIFNKQIRTPNLDRLAEDGVTFTHAYCNCPVCAPSRISFITGQYPHTHRILGNYIHELQDRNEYTMPAVFRRMGYQTSVIGKSHMIAEWDREGFEYIRYSDIIDGDENDPLKNHYFKHLYDNEMAELYDLGRFKGDHPAAFNKGFISKIPNNHCLETWTGNAAMEFLEHRDASRPFFMHLSFQRPHEPLSVPFDRGLLYDPEKLELPASAIDYFENSFRGKHALLQSQAAKKGRGYPYMPEDEKDLKMQMAFYYSIITSIDEQIGRVINFLIDSGDYENTVVVFSADHGDFAGEHGMMFKNLGIYESIHRIPFIFKYPGGESGATSSQIIESVDLFPTLCSVCNINVPACVEGIDLIPVIEGRMQGKEYSICEWDYPVYRNRVNAIRTGKYRFVYYGSDETGELFDLENDPDELINMYDHPEFAAIRMNLLEKLFDHINRYDLKASFGMDRDIVYAKRNCAKMMIHSGSVEWNEMKRVLGRDNGIGRENGKENGMGRDNGKNNGKNNGRGNGGRKRE